jgi:RNA polymerase sigma factor (sigma-70 family)
MSEFKTAEEELYSVIPKRDYNHIKGIAYKVWSKSFSYISIEDLTQEGVIAYLEGKSKYNPEKNDYFMGFIYKRVKGAMLDYVAKNSVGKSHTVRVSKREEGKETNRSKIVPAPENVEMYHVNDCAEDELIDILYREQAREKFFDTLERFNDLEKYILVKYFVEGMSLKEIGAEVKIDRSKIKQIIVACVQFIRRRFNISEKDVNFNFIGSARVR